jgi:hypothetical protein
MRKWACCAVALALSAAASAKDGGFEIALLEASNDFVGKERFGEADLKSFLEHDDAFAKTGALGSGFFEDDKFRFDLVLKDKAFLAWAKEWRLDPKPWLQKWMRIWTLGTKPFAEEIVAHQEKLLEKDWKSLEEQKAGWSKEEYEKQKAYLEERAAFTKRMKDTLAAIPAMSEEEAALWKKYAKELDRIFGDGEEEEGHGEEKGK